jgi:hypothetical protein
VQHPLGNVARAKDAQIAELKATIHERDQIIAVKYGELDKLHDATS